MGETVSINDAIKRSPVLALCFAISHSTGCKPLPTSNTSDIATANSYKTGLFMPERTADLARLSSGFSGSTLSADELIAKLKIDIRRLPAGIRYTIPTHEQDSVLVVRQAPGAKPIPLGGISKDGKIFYLSASIALVEDTPFAAIGKTFFKLSSPNEPMKPVVSSDGNQSNMFQVITVEDGLGGLEEYLVSYLNILLIGEKQPFPLVKIGNKLVSYTSGKTMIEFREVGNQVWVVGGGIANEHLRNGSVLWSPNMIDFYSLRSKDQPVTHWRRQDNNSMDIVAENVNTKIPTVVTEMLDAHANDPEITSEDALLTGPSFATVGIGASSLVDRTMPRVPPLSRGLGLTGERKEPHVAPDGSDSEAFEKFFQPGRVAASLSLNDNIVRMPTAREVAKQDWIHHFQMLRPNTRVALPGGARGIVIARESTNSAIDHSYTAPAGHHYLVQDVNTGEVYKIDYHRKSTGRGPQYNVGQPNSDSRGRTISMKTTKLSASEVANMGGVAQEYRQRFDASARAAQVEIQKFSTMQASFDQKSTDYLKTWSPVDMETRPGDWRPNVQGLGNWALLGASASIPKNFGGSKVTEALVRTGLGTTQALFNSGSNSDGAAGVATEAVRMPTDVILAATNSPYAKLVKVASRVGINQGFQMAQGSSFDGIETGASIVAESTAIAGVAAGFTPWGVAARLARPVIIGGGVMLSAGELELQKRRANVPMTDTINSNSLASLYKQGTKNLDTKTKSATMHPTLPTKLSTGEEAMQNYTLPKPAPNMVNRLASEGLSTMEKSSKPMVLKPVTSATMGGATN